MNVGEVFSKNPLHLHFQSAMGSKPKRLAIFQTNLLMPKEDLAFILSKFDVDPSSHG